jgi:hypothetical protein
MVLPIHKLSHTQMRQSLNGDLFARRPFVLSQRHLIGGSGLGRICDILIVVLYSRVGPDKFAGQQHRHCDGSCYALGSQYLLSTSANWTFAQDIYMLSKTE